VAPDHGGGLTIGDNSVVRQILPHPSGLKLYLIFTHSKVKAQKQLVVFDLVDGEPSGAPRTYPSGLFGGGVTALALIRTAASAFCTASPVANGASACTS